MTMIELAAPCCLTLAAARIDGRPALIGIALRHPPVQLEARPDPQLLVSGARADAAYAGADAFLRSKGLAGGAALELELAVPSHMGLGSSTIVGLAAARALAALHGRPPSQAAPAGAPTTDDRRPTTEGQAGRRSSVVRGQSSRLAANIWQSIPAGAAGLAQDDGLAAHAFAVGGLLAVGEDGAFIRRATVSHADQARDWVFVLVLPRAPHGTSDVLEDTLRAELWDAARSLSAGAEQAAGGELWPAITGDDIAAFAAALARLQALAPAAPPSEAEAAVLAIMRAKGALACGRAPTGLALYALVEGADPSRRLRLALAAHLGHSAGTVMATICDNDGARYRML